MHTASHPQEPVALARIRKFLLVTLAAGLVGTISELLLLGHFESVLQWIPLALLGVGLVIAAWHAARPRPLTVRTLQLLMALFLATGVIGVGLHYDGNLEFELELSPTMSGFELVRNAVSGATPVMAPGSIVLLGLVGLAHAYRHPCVTPTDGGSTSMHTRHPLR